MVRNEFSDRFKFDCFGAANLNTLRKQEKLDEVVAPGNPESEKQVLLSHWAHKRVKHFGGPPPNAPVDALGILKCVDADKTFNCGYIAEVLREGLMNMGYVSRQIGLKGARSDGNGDEHSVVEVWSNQYRKWIILDLTLDMYFLKGRDAAELLRIAAGVVLQQGQGPHHRHRQRCREAQDRRHADQARDAPAGFGTLEDVNSLGKFLYVDYVPATVDGKPDYGQMFITKDKLCESVPYHTRICPKDPATEPYWPMQQAALTLMPGDGAAIDVTAETMTP